jgi:glutathione S-transferase
MKLYFSRNLNPRVAVAVARHLNSPVEFVHASPRDSKQEDAFSRLNPNRLVPVLVESHQIFWETDAIACRLSQLAESDFWRTGNAMPNMIRWISWGTHHFIFACDKVHFERVTKQRYALGPIRKDMVAEGLAEFAESAAILDNVLKDRKWLTDERVSYADFRMASVLPYADAARLPLNEYPHINAWHERLNEIDAWRDPFAGLAAPELPPIPIGNQP